VPFKNNKIGFNEMAYGDYEISFKAISNTFLLKER
jgi:hypothetical protein